MYFPYKNGLAAQSASEWETRTAYRRDLLGQLDLLDDGDLALLDGAFEVHVLDLLAQIGLRVDQADVAIFDLQVDIGALLDGLLDRARRLNLQCLATR